MLLWLNGNTNNKDSPNENYGREMLELFTLGADRGLRPGRRPSELASADRLDQRLERRAGPDQLPVRAQPPRLRDQADLRPSRTIQLARQLPPGGHPPASIRRSWSASCGATSSARSFRAPRARALQRAYVRSGYEIRPLIEAILRHPLFYEGPRLVTPPVVWTAGLLRASRQTITTTSWAWVAGLTGQVLFQPPNVSGWNYAQWLDTSRWAGRLEAVDVALQNHALSGKTYPFGMSENAKRGLPARDRVLGRAPAVRHGTAQPDRARTADRTRPDSGMAAGHVPPASAERATKPDPDDAGLDDRVSERRDPRVPRAPEGHCDGFSRAQAIRRVLAGKPPVAREWDPRMPIPAGAGIDRRRFLAGAAGGLMTVYGAGRLGLTDRMLGDGIARAAALQPARQPDPRVAVHAGRHRRPVAAGAGRRPAVRAIAPDARGGARGRDTAARGPEPHLAPIREFVRHAPQRWQGHGVPEHRLHRPGHVALHLAPLLGGGRHRRIATHRLDGPLPGRGRRRHQPVPGAVDGRPDQPDARHRQEPDGGDRSAQQLRRLSQRRVGRRRRVGARLRVLAGRRPAPLARPRDRPGRRRSVRGGHRPQDAATVPPLQRQRWQLRHERQSRRGLRQLRDLPDGLDRRPAGASRRVLPR